MRTIPLLPALVLPVLVLVFAAGCNSFGATTPATPAGTNAGAGESRITALEARMIGLTEELDRFARRLTALERSLGVEGGATVREPVAPPPGAESGPGPVAEPETRPEARPETPPVSPPAAPPEEQPAAPGPEPEPPEPDPIKDWPVPRKSGPCTSILIDARGIPEGSLPGTSQARWRIVDPEGNEVFSSRKVDPQLLRTRPIFWTAKAETTLGPASIPVLGEKPLEVAAVDGVLVRDEPPPEAVITVSAEVAAMIRALPELPDLVKAGSVAILLRREE
jgi:hypothetical protein